MANKASNFLKKLNPYNIQKGLRYLKHFGVKEFFVNNRFYTTTVAKMAKGMKDNAYRMEDIIC